MNAFVRRAGPLALVLGWFWLCPCHALPVVAQSNLSFSHLGITSAAGTVAFQGPWSAEAFTDADGTTGFDSSFDGTTNAFISTASSRAVASATARPASLSGTASANVSIPHGVAATSFATGRSSLYDSFIVTGGAGSVQVTFSVDLAGSLNVFTDELGVSARAETVFSLELDGTPLLFRDDLLSIGPNDSKQTTIATTLSTTRTLQFGTEYFVFAQSDAESRATATVPDSSTVLADGLALALVAALSALARRKAATASHP